MTLFTDGLIRGFATSDADRLRNRIILLTIVAALFWPVARPHDAIAQDLPMRLTAPSWAHPLGMDELGRDLLARLLMGARISLFVGVSVVGVSALVGTIIGAIAGYLGGVTDAIIGRVMDVLLAFPGILLAIALVAVLGPSLRNVVLALVTIGWVGYARLVRGQVSRSASWTTCRPSVPRVRRSRACCAHM